MSFYPSLGLLLLGFFWFLVFVVVLNNLYTIVDSGYRRFVTNLSMA